MVILCVMNSFDVVVIGAGPGGYPAAIRAAQLGKRVAIVEQEAFGGTCLNWGCIPTKTLIASGDLFHRAGHAAALGVNAAGVTFDYARMVARKSEIVGKLTKGVQMLLQANGVTLVTGQARFEDRRRLSVHAADGSVQWLTAENIVIATGSVSAMPGFLPKHPRVLESRGFLERTELPVSLVILGGGIIGCEFACLTAQLGVRVTVVEMLEDIVVVLDRDVRRVLKRRMESLGITILTGAPLTDIVANDRQVTGKYKDQTVSGDLLLVAVGRKPNTAGLELERAGVKLNERGQIPVDAHGRTAVASIFAVGDVTAGSTQLAHAATAQGIVAAENACGMHTRCEATIPACIFTSPEVGTVGMSETQAQAASRAVKTGMFPFSALGKAMAAGETDGFVKWIADAATGQLLGAQAVGAHATELIAEAALAIRSELTAEELGRTIHSHPTMSEAWMEAAHMVHGACIHLPPKKR
jgi:dihydrolipoamide dehydrogenase